MTLGHYGKAGANESAVDVAQGGHIGDRSQCYEVKHRHKFGAGPSHLAELAAGFYQHQKDNSGSAQMSEVT